MTKRKTKKERFDPNTSRLGTTTPDHIYEALKDILSALEDCKPYQLVTQQDNLWFLEVAERESKKITDYTKAIKEMYGLHEFPSLDERSHESHGYGLADD